MKKKDGRIKENPKYVCKFGKTPYRKYVSYGHEKMEIFWIHRYLVLFQLADLVVLAKYLMITVMNKNIIY